MGIRQGLAEEENRLRCTLVVGGSESQSERDFGGCSSGCIVSIKIRNANIWQVLEGEAEIICSLCVELMSKYPSRNER